MKNSLKTVHEVSRLTGVSIRTLHYYDEIGLLTPAASSEAGYRLYDDTNLLKLQGIMLFRELEFSLKDIAQIMGKPDFDMDQVLDGQLRILELKRDHLEELIGLARRLKQKGETELSFREFDRSKLEAYRRLAKEAWGETDAYREYEAKSAGYSVTDQRRIAEGLMDVFYEFGNLREKDPADPEVQAEVKKLQEYISANYYTCTVEILSCLGRMYSAGGEMTDNIDAAGGKGCAEFVSAAIEVYCSR